MAELKEYVSQQEELGTIHISQDVIASVAALAASEVEGVTGLAGIRSSELLEKLGGHKGAIRGVRLQISEEEGVEIGLSILVKSTAIVRAVAAKVQDAVISSVHDTTGLTIDRVNIHVTGVTLD